MSIPFDVLDFTRKCLEVNGALAEVEEDGLLALLPDSLAQTLDLPREVRFGPGERQLTYGLPLLDRLIERTTREVAIVYGTIEVPYLKKKGFDRAVAEVLAFPKGTVKVNSVGEARSSYMLLTVHYRALSDERRDGLIHLGLHEAGGAEISGFSAGWTRFPTHFFPADKIPPHFPTRPEPVLESGVSLARERVSKHLASFLDAMARRLSRDIRSTREYYGALGKEMEASLQRTGIGAETLAERRAKLEALPREMQRKINDLVQKYSVSIQLEARAALRLLVPVVHLNTTVRYRKYRNHLRLIWNPITGQVDPVTCAHCGKTIRELHFREEQPLRPACETCAGS